MAKKTQEPTELSDMQKFYIDAHRNMELSELAEKSGAKLELITEYINTRKKDHHMITKTDAGRGGVAIMTQQASNSADTTKKDGGGPKSNVHKIR